MKTLEIMKAVDKALTSSVLEKFYSISVLSGDEVKLQGCYRPYLMEEVNKAFGLEMRDWHISQGGYIILEINQEGKKLFNIDGTPINIRFCLTQ